MKWNECLLKAVINGDCTAITLALNNKANVNTKNDDGQTPLHLAAQEERTEAIQLLIEKGADIKAKDNYDQTPLHLATKKGLIETANLINELNLGNLLENVNIQQPPKELSTAISEK